MLECTLFKWYMIQHLKFINIVKLSLMYNFVDKLYFLIFPLNLKLIILKNRKFRIKNLVKDLIANFINNYKLRLPSTIQQYL